MRTRRRNCSNASNFVRANAFLRKRFTLPYVLNLDPLVTVVMTIVPPMSRWSLAMARPNANECFNR